MPQIHTFTLDMDTVPCPECHATNRWDSLKPATRRAEDPGSIIGIEAFCDCGATTVIYLDFTADMEEHDN